MMKNKELKEDELNNLNGGFNEEETKVHTQMECSYGVCGQRDEWIGNYLEQVFECPVCHHNTYKGVKLIQQ